MKISVLMSVWKTPLPWLKEAVNSILNQDFQDFQLIIVDDDNERGELTDYLYGITEHSCCLNIVRNPNHKGFAQALDFGITYCTGDIIVRMDTDDIALPGLLGAHHDFFTHNPDKHVCGVQVELFNGEQVWYSHHPAVVTRKYARERSDYWIINHPGSAYRKDAFLSIGGYGDTPAHLAEDYKLWVKFLNAGYLIYNRQDVLLKYRVHESVAGLQDRRGEEWHNWLKQIKQTLYE